jgi:intein/homing endonuclease
VSGSPLVFLTANHKVLVKGDDGEEPAWVSCADLKVGDLVSLPNYSGEEKGLHIDVRGVVADALADSEVSKSALCLIGSLTNGSIL